jgi:hypothetical protein
MKFIISGYGCHGKSEVCNTLKSHFGMRPHSSSWVAKEQVYAASELIQSKYVDPGVAHENRRYDREEWFKRIQEINTPDKTALAQLVFKMPHCDVYDGMRDTEELRAVKRTIECISIWVYNPTVKPEESSSCTIRAADCDLVLMNSGTLPELQRRVIGVFSAFKGL